jgi:hypothetical protein
MRKTFTPFDDLLIERLFQPASDTIACHIGISQRTSIGLCLDAASIAWIVSRAPSLSAAVGAWNATAAFLELAFLMLGLTALLSLRILFRRPKERQGNPLRPAMQPHRAMVLLMLAASVLQLPTPGVAEAADIVMLTFATLSLYLGACTDQPPLHRRRTCLVAAG